MYLKENPFKELLLKWTFSLGNSAILADFFSHHSFAQPKPNFRLDIDISPGLTSQAWIFYK